MAKDINEFYVVYNNDTDKRLIMANGKSIYWHKKHMVNALKSNNIVDLNANISIKTYKVSEYLSQELEDFINENS